MSTVVITHNQDIEKAIAGARLLGFNVDAVHHLWEAVRLGLGETETDEIDFPAEYP